MAGKCAYAAALARNMVGRTSSAEYNKLSSAKGGDAIAYIALLAGIIDDNGYRSLLNNAELLVSVNDARVDNSNDMLGLPEGHMLGFFEQNNTIPIHVMLSTGNGGAAGNNNDCIGIGNTAGWEDLNLVDQYAGLNWAPPGIQAPNPRAQATLRKVYLCQRAIDLL